MRSNSGLPKRNIAIDPVGMSISTHGFRPKCAKDRARSARSSGTGYRPNRDRQCTRKSRGGASAACPCAR